MAIAASSLTGDSSLTDATSYATASITPTANRLVLAFVSNTALAAVVNTTPTVTGNGLTWVQVATVQTDDATLGVRSTVFRALGASPSAGAVTIDFGGVTQTRCGWSIVEFSDIDTSGTNGSGAVVQSKTAFALTGTAGAADFDAAFGDGTNNATYSGISIRVAEAITEEAGFTELHDVAFGGNNAHLQTMWRVGEDQNPAPTWTSSVRWAQVVVEIKAAGGAGAQSLTGALFTKAPTFPTGTITATRNLAGVLFTKAPTFNTGAITATRNLAGVLFQKVPTFSTGTVTAGAVTLAGVLFTKAPTFSTGAVSLGAGSQALSGILFQKAPTFPTGVITAGAVSLTGVLFTKAPTFPTGVVSSGASVLTGVLFQKAPTFPTGTVTAGAVNLAGVPFTNSPIFPTGTIGQSGTIFGNLFVNSPVFFTGSMAQPGPTFWSKNPVAFVKVGPAGPSPWGTELSGELFLKAPTFPVGAVI